MLNKSNITEMTKKGSSFNFNCWGATRYALGLTDRPIWECQHEMEEFLGDETSDITGNLQKGDILSLWDEWDNLMHTATYVGGGLYWHKVGAQHARYNTKKEIIELYEEFGIEGMRITRHNYLLT